MKLAALLALLLAATPAAAQPCGLFGAMPYSMGRCSVDDPCGRPSVRLTEPYPGTGFQATPVPGYQPINPSPSTWFKPQPDDENTGGPPTCGR